MNCHGLFDLPAQNAFSTVPVDSKFLREIAVSLDSFLSPVVAAHLSGKHVVIGGKANGRRSETVDVNDCGARNLRDLFNAAEIWVKRKGHRNGQEFF